MKKIIILFLVLALALSLGGCCLKHEWVVATCTEPATCVKCGATEGEALEHVPGKWVAENANILGGKETQKCDVCGEALGSRAGSRGEREAVTVLEPSRLVMTAEEFAKHLINYLPEDCYITDITSSGFNIKGKGDVIVCYDDEEHSYKDNIGIISENKSDIVYLLKYIIPAVDPRVTENDLSKAVSEATGLLNNRTDGLVLLYTGVGYIHYTERLTVSSRTTIPAQYCFCFFTLQCFLS